MFISAKDYKIFDIQRDLRRITFIVLAYRSEQSREGGKNRKVHVPNHICE